MCNFSSCRYRGPYESSIDGVEEAVVNEHVEDNMEGTGLQLTPIRPLFYRWRGPHRVETAGQYQHVENQDESKTNPEDSHTIYLSDIS